MALVKLPRLHRGFWVYQSSRILLLVAYLWFRGLNSKSIVEVVKTHIDYVMSRLKLVHEKFWIVERLEMLGYQPRRAGSRSLAESLNAKTIQEYMSRMKLDELSDVMVENVEAFAASLGLRETRGLAYLPPVLSTPEKLILIRALSSSTHFNLLDSLRVLRDITLGEELHSLIAGDRDTVNREFRFRYCHLYSLHLAGGTRRKPRITGLGSFILSALMDNRRAEKAYAMFSAQTQRLHRMIMLDAIAFDALSESKLDRLLEYEAEMLKKLGLDNSEKIVSEVSRMFAPTPTDKPGVHIVTPLENIDEVLEKLYD